MIFRNKSIDFLRKENNRRKYRNAYLELFAGSNDILSAFALPDTPASIEDIFKKLDQKVRLNPNLMSKIQLRFYEIYKTLFLVLTDDKSIKRIVKQQMDISDSYYGKLKYQLVSFLKDTI
jgi:hypothetical protein